MKTLLPNNCHVGKISVSPKNWKQIGASIKKDWYIHYRFHDPLYGSKFPKGKLVMVAGMNAYKSLDDRRIATKEILVDELSLLKNEGYNPITGKYSPPSVEQIREVEPTTPVLKALQFGLDKVNVEKGTRDDMKSMLKYFSQATIKQQYQDLEINEVRRRHLKRILEEVSIIRDPFSNCRYNKYRTYLMIIFTELMELEAVDSNPPKDLRKRKEATGIRTLLTPKQREIVNEYLFTKYKNFWRLLHIFFHSGSRETEIVRVKLKDVDVERQQCKYLVKKGGAWHEVLRPIKDSVLHLWQEAINGATPEDYIFSKGLRPGPVQINANQITKRWYRLVKQNATLGITADFYSLKHLNTDETAALLNIADAAAQNSHTSTVITMKHYAFGEKERQNERLKKVGNKFA